MHGEAEFFDPWKSPLDGNGVAQVLAKALEGTEGISFAFVFGSLAAGSPRQDSDADFFVVGSIDLLSVVRRTSRLSDQSIGRELNTVHYTEDEFRARVQSRNHFVRTVLASPKIFVVGSDRDVDRLAGQASPNPSS